MTNNSKCICPKPTPDELFKCLCGFYPTPKVTITISKEDYLPRQLNFDFYTPSSPHPRPVPDIDEDEEALDRLNNKRV